MPVTWEVGPRLVIVTVTGDYRRADVDAAIEAALAAPAFQSGSALQFDVRAALTCMTANHVPIRIANTVARATPGIDSKIAVIASDASDQYPRVLAAEEFVRGVNEHGREVRWFTNRAAAEQWLAEPGPETSGPSGFSERTFRLLFESNPLPMWVFDIATAYSSK